MPLTNSQYDAIMRTYDITRSNNARILEERYKEVLSLKPEIKDLEDEIITISMNAATARISGQGAEYSAKLTDLQQKMNNCLASIGKPADYLKEIYTCRTCRDKGYIGSKKCECFMKKAVDLIYSDSNLKNITDNENFNTLSYQWYDNETVNPSIGLTPYQNMQKVVEICHNFINTFDNEFQNILFFGDSGLGKTFLSNCIARELIETGHSVIYLTAQELFQQFEKQDFGKDRYNDPQESDTSYITECDLLIIDDLGTEVANTYTNSKLFYTINERILRQKSVIISTNLSLSDIRDMYSERIFSRIAGSYKILKLFGEDIRKLKRRTSSKN